MRRKIGAVEAAMKYKQLVFLVVGLLILIGVFALYDMPREEFPTVTIRQGLVIGIYPGATSKEVEEQLTTQVERYLFSFKEINKAKTYSHSRDGLMVIYVTLNDNVNNADEFWSKLSYGLNNFKTQLPSGVLALVADNNFGETSALLITLETQNRSYRDLEHYLYRLEDELRRIPSVSNVRHYGLQEEQIAVYVDKNKLDKYGISKNTILATLFTQGLRTVGGSVDNGKNDVPIHVTSQYQTEQDVANQIIYSDPSGAVIRLKDVARIVREYPQPDSYIQIDGKKCLVISMEMLPGHNIVKYGKDVEKVLKQFQKTLPPGITVQRIVNQPHVVSYSIEVFLREFIIAILAVILVTMLLLPFRVASVAASSIPITIFIALGIMDIFGMELNTVTLAGLIVVLGMIVDNSVVIVDDYMQKLDEGMSRWYASIASAKEFFNAILAATLAISITFFPFLITLKGEFKDFVVMFPWTVTITLGISLLVAVLVIPFLQYYFVRTGFSAGRKEPVKKHFDTLNLIQSTYEKYLMRAFKHPKRTLWIGGLSVIAGLILFKFVPQRLMPTAERNQFPVEIYLPDGSSLQQTELVADSLQNMLRKDKRVKSITAFIGTSSPRFHTTYAPNFPSKNYAQFIVNTVSNDATVALLNEYSDKYSRYFPNAYVRFKQLDFEPVQAMIEVRLSGNDQQTLMQTADSMLAKMRMMNSLRWVHTDFETQQPIAKVNLNSVAANQIGITEAMVSSQLAANFNGLPLTTIWEKDYPVSVMLKTDQAGQQHVTDISNTYIHSVIPGVSVPLRQIATVSPCWTQGQLVRRNGIPTVTIMADVARGLNVNNVFDEVQKVVQTVHIPEGVTLSYGGAHESDAETLPGIIEGLLASLVIIFLILMFHFKKVRLALLVFGSASLSIVGALLGVLIMHVDFSLTSILGVVSLVGIIVRNGMIMLDYAESLRYKHHESIMDAAIHAGKRRMRPIFLTSAAASMGVVPMMLSQSSLWTPMGVVIFFGTLTSMVLLVLILPVAYWMMYRHHDQIITEDKVSTATTPYIKPLIIGLLIVGTGFGHVTAQKSYNLEQCKQLAIRNNTIIKNAKLDVQTSKQVKAAALTNYFPNVSASVNGFLADKPLLKMDIPGGNLPVYNGNPAQLLTPTQFAYFPGMNLNYFDKGILSAVTLTQPVFAGGRIINGNKLATIGVLANQSKEKLATNEVLLHTEESFWQVISLQEKMKTLNQYTLFLDSLYKQVDDAYHAGLINRNDVMKVTLKQSELDMNRLKLTHGIALSKMALCQYIGVPYDSSMVFSQSIDSIVPPEHFYVSPQEALQNREEYKLLQDNVKAQKLQTRIKTGSYLPEIGVGVSEAYYNFSTMKDYNTLAFVSVKIPLTDWWEASHTIKEQHLKEQKAANDLENNSELLILQIRKAWDELTEAYAQINVAKITVQQAEENLRLNQDNFKAGLVNVSDMLESEAMLQQAENELIDAKSAYKTKQIAYLQAVGKE